MNNMYPHDHHDRDGTIEAAHGQFGHPMSLDDLPPANTKRWVIRRKAEVVAGVRQGLISLEDACRRYDLSEDEFHSWERLLDNHGMAGLRVTRVKEYRSAPVNDTGPPSPRGRLHREK